MANSKSLAISPLGCLKYHNEVFCNESNTLRHDGKGCINESALLPHTHRILQL